MEQNSTSPATPSPAKVDLSKLTRYEPAIYAADAGEMLAHNDGQWFRVEDVQSLLVSAAAAQEPQKMAEAFANLLSIQKREAETGDPYMVGLYNGMSMMCANIDGDLNWQPMEYAAPVAAQAAVPEGWRAWLPEKVEGWQDGFGVNRSAKAPEIITLTIAGSAFQLYENEFAFLLDKMLGFVSFDERAAPEVPPAEPAAEQSDPLDWPLPCDVTIGPGTHKKGTKLSALVDRARRLHELVTGQVPFANVPIPSASPAEPAPIQTSAEKLGESEIIAMADAACLNAGRVSTVIDFARAIEREVLARLSKPASEQYSEAAENLRALAKSGRELRQEGRVYNLLPHDIAELERVAGLLASKPASEGTAAEAASIDTPEFQRLLADFGSARFNHVQVARERLIAHINRHIAAQPPAGQDAIRAEALEEAARHFEQDVFDQNKVHMVTSEIRALKSQPSPSPSGKDEQEGGSHE